MLLNIIFIIICLGFGYITIQTGRTLSQITSWERFVTEYDERKKTLPWYARLMFLNVELFPSWQLIGVQILGDKLMSLFFRLSGFFLIGAGALIGLGGAITFIFVPPLLDLM